MPFFPIFYDRLFTAYLHNISGSSFVDFIIKEFKVELTMFEDMVTSVLLSVITTDEDSIGGAMVVVGDTDVVVGGDDTDVVSDGFPHITLVLPPSPPLNPLT